jgi:hypothetical protein
LTDTELELEIQSTIYKMKQAYEADDHELSTTHSQRLANLIKQRSYEQISRMEKAIGLH